MDDERTEFLGSQDIATGGPFKLEMQVMLIDKNGQHDGYTAWATLDLPPGKIPTKEWIESRLGSALDAADGFRLATRREFVSELLSEKTGVPCDGISVPGPTEFDLTARVGD